MRTRIRRLPQGRGFGQRARQLRTLCPAYSVANPSLHKRHLIHVEAGSEAFDIDLCALSYVNAVLNADFPDIMQEAVTSLFNYYQAAAAYVPNDS